jgi:transcriptional regulator with XRE-family HTH domain
MGESAKRNSENIQTFGKKLASIRKSKGLTQTELGKRIGVSQRIMHHYENKAEYPPPTKIIELAKALDMSMDELLQPKNNTKKHKNINHQLAKRLRLASDLPTPDMRALITFIDALLLKQRVKQNNETK